NPWTFAGGINGTLVLTAASTRTGDTYIDNTTQITDPAQLGTGSVYVDSLGTLDLTDLTMPAATELNTSGTIRANGNVTYSGEIYTPANTSATLDTGAVATNQLQLGDATHASQLISDDDTPTLSVNG